MVHAMAKGDNIHDKLVKDALSEKDLAVDFLANYLPSDVLQHIDLTTLALCKDSFVDEKQSERFSDLLYQARFSGDRTGFVYFLFEHKSRPYRFTALQLLRYLLEIWELFLKQNRKARTLPLIIPIVIYHGKPRGRAILLIDLIDLPSPNLAAYVPNFALAFYDFSPRTDNAIKGRILLQLILSCLQAKNTPEAVDKLVRIFHLLAGLDEDETSLRWMQVIFRYLSQTMDIDQDVVHDLAKENVPPEKEEMIMTIAEQWKQQGRVEGRQAMLQRQFTKRFGQTILDIQIQERLRKATPEQLDLWAEKLLDAKSIEDIFKDH